MHQKAKGPVLIVATLVIVALAAAALLLRHLGFSAPDDPRAYPGSHSQSLERSLEDYGLALPDCAQDSVRFALFKQFRADSFYLYFAEERECIEDFLEVNPLGDEQTAVVSGLSRRPGPAKTYGWPAEMTREYLYIGGTAKSEVGNLIAIEVHIDWNVNPPALYLWAGGV